LNFCARVKSNAERTEGINEHNATVDEDELATRRGCMQELAIEGGSNGGLLVGAALTQRPDLFQAVVCEYPLEDMLRLQKFLAGPYWVSEYGSSDDPTQFSYLYAYSPYHHVKDGVRYPVVLFIHLRRRHACGTTACTQVRGALAGSDSVRPADSVVVRHKVRAFRRAACQ
jgi:hypothetical protein